MRPRQIVSSIAGLVMVAAACAQTPEPEVVAIPDDYLLPGESLVDPDNLNDLIEEAKQDFVESEQRLTTCLRGEGFTYTPATVRVETGSNNGLLTYAQSISLHGYGIVDGEANAGISATIRSGTVPPDQDQALDAALEAGPCSQLVNLVDPQILIGDARGEPAALSERMLASPEFVDAQQAWASCMSQHGYDFRSPADAFAEVESRVEQAQSSEDQDTSTQDSSELLQFEIEVAETDLGCFLTEVDPVIRNLLTQQR